MPDANDPTRELRIALDQPKSLDRLVETYRRVEELAKSGELPTEKAGNLLAQAFSTMQELAQGDSDLSRHLILDLLLPRCLSTPEDSEGKYAASRHREILGSWLEDLAASGDSAVRDEVVDVLRKSLDTAQFKEGCWSLAEVGFCREDVISALWSFTDRESGEDGDVALATLVALGEGVRNGDRLLAALHGRARLRHSHSLMWAIGSLGDPTSLEVVEKAWLRDLTTPIWRREFFGLVRVVSDIADANPHLPETQDRAWAILTNLKHSDPENIGAELAIGGDIATLCDCPRVIPDLLAMLDARAGDTDREEHGRYLLYLRVRECVRPRQLEGWSVPVAESTLSVLLRDATRDTKTSGIYRTLAMDLKRHAWDILLSLGRSEMLSTRMFESAIATETGPFVRRSIIEWLACFRYPEIPPTAARWVTEPRCIPKADAAADLTFRAASTRLLQSAASREAFDLLLRTGFSLEGSALLSSLDALSEVSHSLAAKDDPSIARELVNVLTTGEERNQRVAAAAALIVLAASERLPEPLIAPIWHAALDSDRDDHELSRIVSVLGHLPRSLLPAVYEENLVRWARGSGQLAHRAVEALARQEFLPDRPELMSELVGLTNVGGRWTFMEGARASDVHGFAIGLLFEARPDLFEDVLAHYIRERDWVVVAQVIHLLDRIRKQGRDIPHAFVDAIVSRIRRFQTEYTTETEPFDILSGWGPRALVDEPWENTWTRWMPEARVALADALGRLAGAGRDAQERALEMLLMLTQDGTYAVRRSAYRATSKLSPRALLAFCETSLGSESRELRRRGAEACGWIADDGVFEDTYRGFASDPEKAVRDAVRSAKSERRTRKYAGASLDRVKSAKAGDTEAIILAWSYGRALARTGDDETPWQIRQFAATEVFQDNVGYWLGRIVKGVVEHWRDVTQKWPEPWYSWDGALVRGVGKIASPGGNDVAVEYCIVKEPAKGPTGVHGWHGVAWATEAHLPFMQDDREEELVLSDGSRGQILVTNRSFDKMLFTGCGPYPRPD